MRCLREFVTTSLAAFAMLSSPARADDLDKPAVAAGPTLRGELQRGYDLAIDCMLKSGADSEKFEHCIKDVSSTQLIQSLSNDEFLLGLYFIAAIAAKNMFEVRRNESSRGICKLYVIHVKELETKLKLPDARLVKEFGMADDELEVIADVKASCV